MAADRAVVAGVRYRVAHKGEACHEWTKWTKLRIGDSDDLATLVAIDDDSYELRFDRSASGSFRHGNLVCVHASFVNPQGDAGKARSWSHIEMPSVLPVSKPASLGPARAESDIVEFDFKINPYDWPTGIKYRIARNGSACNDWTSFSDTLQAGKSLGEARLVRIGDRWRLTLNVGDGTVMRPGHRYCVDVNTVNRAGRAGSGRRWQFTTID